MLERPLGFDLGGEMTFVLLRVEYDRYTERAYVEFRAPDGDGGDAITTAIFSYKTAERLSKRRIQEEVVRKARHLLKRLPSLRNWARHDRAVRRSRSSRDRCLEA